MKIFGAGTFVCFYASQYFSHKIKWNFIVYLQLL